MQTETPQAVEHVPARPRRATQKSQSATKAPWQSDVEGALGERTSVIRDSLSELADVIEARGEPIAWWTQAGKDTATVYVLSPGILHRVQGDRDPEPSYGAGETPEGSATCEHEWVPITPKAQFRLATERAWGAGGSEQLTRRWHFHLNPLTIDVTVTARATDSPTRQDAVGLTFARALAAEIAGRRDGPQ